MGVKEMKRTILRKHWLLITALVLILTVSVGGTIAYLIDRTEAVVNTFAPSSIPTEVEENEGNSVKKDVVIRNKGNIDAYIRAQIIVTWQDDNGNVYSTKPVEGYDYTINIGSGWDYDTATGFYYCKTAVEPGETTPNLIDNLTILETSKAPADGYKLHVEILAQAIQAEGTGATTAQEAFEKAAAATTE